MEIQDPWVFRAGSSTSVFIFNLSYEYSRMTLTESSQSTHERIRNPTLFRMFCFVMYLYTLDTEAGVLKKLSLAGLADLSRLR